MANGVTAHLPLEPPSTAAKAQHKPDLIGATTAHVAPPPAAPPSEQPIEQKIAEATADIIQVICRSVREYAAHGMMDPETKTKTGDVFLRMYELQAVVGESVFPVVARREGKVVLRQRYATLRRPGDPDFDEALIDDFLTHALGILKKVTETEKIFAKAWAN